MPDFRIRWREENTSKKPLSPPRKKDQAFPTLEPQIRRRKGRGIPKGEGKEEEDLAKYPRVNGAKMRVFLGNSTIKEQFSPTFPMIESGILLKNNR